MNPVRKRSIDIAGKKTSVSVEEEFWTALKELAAVERLQLRELVARIDNERENKITFLPLSAFTWSKFSGDRHLKQPI